MHIELTNGCNAACPMCVRFHNNSPMTRPDLEISQITLDLFMKWFPIEIIKQCRLILFCGVHGDPSVAKDMYEICEYISDCSTTKVMVNTNGGARTPGWWHKLGLLFAKNIRKDWQLTFSIDGLEDTNHLYRRNVVWKKLEANVLAFTESSPKCDWDFLMFKHNEHQVEEARSLCRKWNITNFIPKKALGVDNGTNLKAMPAINDQGKLDYWIEAPEDPEKRILKEPKEAITILEHYEFSIEEYRKSKKEKQVSQSFKDQVKNVYSRIEVTDTTEWDNSYISCKSKVWSSTDKKEIFIDNFGRVLPCCYVGTHLNGTYTDVRTLQLHKHMDDYGWDNFSLHKHSLQDILNNNHLNRVFADSWDKENVGCGKLAYCADTCGKRSSIDEIFTHKSIENKQKFAKYLNVDTPADSMKKFLIRKSNDR
jgi:MoaA/NifB/PqqE/SkfB family radical SAM enzyme